MPRIVHNAVSIGLAQSAFLVSVLSMTASPGLAADLGTLIEGDVQKVAGGFAFTEGPAWHPGGYLLFSDIPNNRIVRVEVDGTVSDWVTDSGGANGLMCDTAGNVYAAQGEAAQVGIFRATDDGKGRLVKVVAKEYEGKPFNRPNDLALDAEGGLYVTDPNYGNDPPEQPVEGVYYIAADGTVNRVVHDLPRPNGVLVTRDGKSLLVANINLRQIIRYEIESAGRLSGGEVIFTGEEDTDGNGPDGMSLDEQGNIYATYKSLVVLTPEGELIGRVEIPEKPANCAFGGDDHRTLYITARTGLYSIPMKVAGIPLREGEQVASADADNVTAETVAVKAGELTLQVPKSWKSNPPSSDMRLAQFEIPPVEGDEEPADLVIFPPFGGGVAANVQRWIAQFASQGRQLKLTQGESEQGKYVLVDITGTYNKPEGPPILQRTVPTPGYRMLAVLFSKPGAGDYSFKLTGPAETVGSVTEQFRQSFGGDAEQEKPYEF